jgi:hypothetical protein
VIRKGGSRAIFVLTIATTTKQRESTKKKRAQKCQSAERERKKRDFALFPFTKTQLKHWKPGYYRAQSLSTVMS